MMHLESLTNSEIVRELRDDHGLSERELVLLDRLISLIDEVDGLTCEVRALLPKPDNGDPGK